ncbi:MAG: phytanoyl-CoA dioxygenase family protein [Gammaproteobacteria bacterium]|nr:phytanoyl-CoA dioxygenase family protein [Gammaproteobacteria bacterium]
MVMQKPAQDQIERYAQDGVYLAEQLLTPAQLEKARSCYDYVRANPSPSALTAFAGTEHEHFVDQTNPESWKLGLRELVREASLAEYLAELWGSEHVWYFGEEYFAKEGGKVSHTPWHQDHSVFPVAGWHWVNLWIPFEPLPAHNSLGVVRGSHRGKLYNGTTYTDADDMTKPLYPDSDYERLPDIEADLERDPNAWDVVSFETRPGDVVVVHPYCLHGRATIDARTPDRHTLVLRFFGDDVTYSPLPGPHDWLDLDSEVPGAPLRSPAFVQLR